MKNPGLPRRPGSSNVNGNVVRALALIDHGAGDASLARPDEEGEQDQSAPSCGRKGNDGAAGVAADDLAVVAGGGGGEAGGGAAAGDDGRRTSVILGFVMRVGAAAGVMADAGQVPAVPVLGPAVPGAAGAPEPAAACATATSAAVAAGEVGRIAGDGFVDHFGVLELGQGFVQAQ